MTPEFEVDPSTLTVRKIFEEHAPFVWRTVRYLGVADSDIEDLCQEVFVVVHRRLADFEARSTVSTWLYGICVRVVAGHQRRAHVRLEDVVDVPPERTQAPPQAAVVEHKEKLALLAHALDLLTPERRAVFVLYEIQELPMREVAEALECPLQTAYSRHKAARAIVGAYFEERS